MSESDYWERLEFRLCGEFAGMADRRLAFLWCDGFMPQWYLLTDPSPRITAQVVCVPPLSNPIAIKAISST